MLAKQYMVNVFFPRVRIGTLAAGPVPLASPVESWHAKHWAWPNFGLLLGFGPDPYRILPRSSEAVNWYPCAGGNPANGGVPYLERSQFELNRQTSPEPWNAATPSANTST